MANKGDAGKVETRTVTYLAPGVAPDPYQGEPSIDPELEKIREREAKALADVKIDTAPQEPTIDPELVKIRDEQIKRERERAGATDDGGTVKKSTTKKSVSKSSDK